MFRLLAICSVLLGALIAIAACSDPAPPPAPQPTVRPMPQPAPAPPPPAALLGDRKPTLFALSAEDALTAVKSPALEPQTSIHETLQRICQHLTETHFAATSNGQPTGIELRVVRIETLAATERPLSIGVVELHDPRQMAADAFFQGSLGATHTFQLLVASLTQPQLSPPLLDGLVLLRNGQSIAEMDHINLSGILVPRLARTAAVLAVQAATEGSHHAL